MDIQRHLKTKISRHGPDGEAGNLSSIPVWATKLVLTNAVGFSNPTSRPPEAPK